MATKKRNAEAAKLDEKDGSVKVQIEDKPANKARKTSDDDAAAAAAVPAAATPTPPSQDVIKSPHVIYPPYDDFDPKLIAFAKDPQASKEGGGQILFMSYVFTTTGEDGAKKSITKPLLIQSPNGMYAPMGIKMWPDGKATMLISCGREWESNPLIVKYRDVIDAIQQRAAEVVAEKEWNNPQPNEVDVIKEHFTPLMFVSEGEKGDPFPPSMKTSVIMLGSARSELFEYSPKPPLRMLVNSDVPAGCSVTAIVHIPWIYRKKDKKAWQFSIRANLFQAVVDVGGANTGGNMDRRGCSVVF